MKRQYVRLPAAAYFCYVFIVLLMLISAPPPICIASVLSALLHELAHVACARAFGRRIRPLSFSPAGLCPDVGEGSALSCIVIYAAGPLTNVIICVICILTAREHYDENVLSVLAANAALAAYNLTPVPFSDGGGIMRCVLAAFLGERVGALICSALELVFSFVFFVLFSYRFFAVGTGFFSFFCAFVFLLASIQSLSVK